MAASPTIVELVVQRPPCGSCQIVEQLLREAIEKAIRGRNDATLMIREIRRPCELRTVDGLEVERMPALIVGGEQVSAGRIVTVREIQEYIDELQR